jgi:hypothetical protein
MGFDGLGRGFGLRVGFDLGISDLLPPEILAPIRPIVNHLRGASPGFSSFTALTQNRQHPAWTG